MMGHLITHAVTPAQAFLKRQPHKNSPIGELGYRTAG
jgi:hypothetical protein